MTSSLAGSRAKPALGQPLVDRHKGAVHLLGLFARVGVALFVRWAKNQRRVRDRTYPTWREWNSGHRWQMVRQVVD